MVLPSSSLLLPDSAGATGLAPIALPPSVWRAHQMASWQAPVIASGHTLLDRQLPAGGWPSSALIELLLQQPGIGEMRLLKPALTAIAGRRRVALVQPPHLPQVAAWTSWGLAPERLLWIRPRRSADALWSAEQILKNGSCGALLFWQPQVRTESLRRLHLAAQGSDTVFWMIRPLAWAQNASPAPLRLTLRPVAGGVMVEIVKRRGPQCEAAFLLPLEGAGPALIPVCASEAERDKTGDAAGRMKASQAKESAEVL